MQVNLTITWEGVLLSVLAIAGICLLVYLIILLKKLIGTLSELDEILADAKIITGIAADKAVKVDGIIDNAADTVDTVVSAIKGNQSMVSAATNFVNATSSFANIMKKTEPKQRRKKTSK